MLRVPVVFAVLACATTMAAQSVRPAVMEYTAAASGQYEVVNDSPLPLVITMEARSFTIDEQGVAHFTPLQSSIHLQLSQTSMKLPPQGRRTVFYKATADAYPAWFCIYSVFTGLPRRGAMNVSLELPHTVYLLNKRGAKTDDVQFHSLHVEHGALVGTVENHGAAVVRLQTLQWMDRTGKKTEAGGFPLLPGGVRALNLVLPAGAAPQHLHARAGKLSIDSDVR
jgi:hypothetical protein